VNKSIVSKILLATDFSDSAALAQVYTEFLAGALKASVAVLHVNELPPAPRAVCMDEGEIRTRLQALRDRIAERSVPVSVHRSAGNPANEIVNAAMQHDIDVIAMGIQGHAHVPYGLIGSTARAVTTSGPCPVLTVPLPRTEGSPSPFISPAGVAVRRILAPVDFSAPSLDSLECAIYLSHRLGADLVLLHVLEPVHADWDLHRMQGAAQTRDQWEARLGDLTGIMKTLGVSATYETRTGFPPHSILACALHHQCDLIVMGTHGRRGREQRNVGSVAEAVLKQAACPVLTVRTPKFVAGGRAAIRAVLSKTSEEAATEER
jgi:nucleotide-binding universal stress UspA family protein